METKFIISALRYLLHHEDYVELPIHQKIEAKTNFFKGFAYAFDNMTVL